MPWEELYCSLENDDSIEAFVVILQKGNDDE